MKHVPPFQALLKHVPPFQALLKHVPSFQALLKHVPPFQALLKHVAPFQAVAALGTRIIEAAPEQEAAEGSIADALLAEKLALQEEVCRELL